MASTGDSQTLNERKNAPGSDTAPDAPETHAPVLEKDSSLSSATLEEIRALRRTTSQTSGSDFNELFGGERLTDRTEGRTDGAAVGTDRAEGGTEKSAVGTDRAEGGTEKSAVGTDRAEGGTDNSAGGTDQSEARTEQAERARVEAMRRDLAEHGREPAGVLNNLMRENQVVMIGEGHGAQESQRIHGPEYLRSLAAGGATHLVIESGPESAAMLEEFNRTGELDPSKLPILLRDENFYNVLRTARELGLMVVPGDSEHTRSDDPNRDRTMADTIRGILNEPNQDPNNPNRVVFWVGSWHLNDFSDRPNRTSDGLAAEQLRRSGVSLATVSYEDGDNYGYSLPARAATGLSEPSIVSTREARNIGDYVDATMIPTRNSADYIIFYPPKNR